MVQAGNSIEEILRRVGQRVGADVAEPLSILHENWVHTTEAFEEMTDADLTAMGLKLGVIKQVRAEIRQLEEGAAAAGS